MSDDYQQEIHQEAYRQLQLLNKQALRAGKKYFKFEDALYDKDVLQVTVKRSGGSLYKFFIRYDQGDDTYSVRFGKVYTGIQYKREDWGEFFITDWQSGVYNDMLYDILSGYWRDHKKLVYRNIAEEWKVKEAAAAAAATAEPVPATTPAPEPVADEIPNGSESALPGWSERTYAHYNRHYNNQTFQAFQMYADELTRWNDFDSIKAGNCLTDAALALSSLAIADEVNYNATQYLEALAVIIPDPLLTAHALKHLVNFHEDAAALFAQVSAYWPVNVPKASTLTVNGLLARTQELHWRLDPVRADDAPLDKPELYIIPFVAPVTIQRVRIGEAETDAMAQRLSLCWNVLRGLDDAALLAIVASDNPAVRLNRLVDAIEKLLS